MVNRSAAVAGLPLHGHMFSVQGVDLDAETRRVWRNGKEIRLSNKEFDLLHALIRRPGEIVTRDQLMREVWQTNFWTSAKTIDVHLGWLRRKLGDDTRRPTLITTIRGKGLRFEESPPEYEVARDRVPRQFRVSEA
jgi:DNA-binding response OmpR family regulator